jgi:probable selenium-dependent hydroxylase accessory protein YqeC
MIDPCRRAEGSHLPDLWRLGPGEVISVVGAGGKSTLLELLARQYEREGERVILATTTRMWPPQPGADARPLVTATDLPGLLAQLEAAPERSPVVGRSVLPNGKLEDVPQEWVPALRDLGWVGAVIVEADGAAGRPLKAPAAWEPVVPDCTTLMVVMSGLDSQGARLDEDSVHRPKIVGRLLGLSQGAILPDDAPLRAALLGYRPVRPPHGRMLVLLNKADAFPVSRGLARAAESADVEVWAGSTGTTPASFSRLHPGPEALSVVVLAAGAATRMGGSKVLAQVGAGTMLERVVGVACGAAGAGEVVVVVREQDEAQVRGLLARWTDGGDPPVVRVEVNHHPEKGMASSLALAVGSVACGDLLVMLADQPFAGPATVTRLLEARARSPRAAAAALASGADWGPPVLIGRSLVPRLISLEGDKGARDLLRRFLGRLVLVNAQDEEAMDVDTPDDLESARRRTL